MSEPVDSKWTAATERDILTALILSNGPGTRNNWVKAHEAASLIGYNFSKPSLCTRWNKITKEFHARLPPGSQLFEEKTPRKRTKKTQNGADSPSNKEVEDMAVKKDIEDNEDTTAASRATKRRKLELESTIDEATTSQTTIEGEKSSEDLAAKAPEAAVSPEAKENPEAKGSPNTTASPGRTQ